MGLFLQPSWCEMNQVSGHCFHPEHHFAEILYGTVCRPEVYPHDHIALFCSMSENIRRLGYLVLLHVPFELFSRFCFKYYLIMSCNLMKDTTMENSTVLFLFRLISNSLCHAVAEIGLMAWGKWWTTDRLHLAWGLREGDHRNPGLEWSVCGWETRRDQGSTWRTSPNLLHPKRSTLTWVKLASVFIKSFRINSANKKSCNFVQE